jgi:hypothetical protein
VRQYAVFNAVECGGLSALVQWGSEQNGCRQNATDGSNGNGCEFPCATVFQELYGILCTMETLFFLFFQATLHETVLTACQLCVRAFLDITQQQPH